MRKLLFFIFGSIILFYSSLAFSQLGSSTFGPGLYDYYIAHMSSVSKGTYWGETRYEWDKNTGELLYVGLHVVRHTPTVSNNWTIKKFYYDSQGNRVMERVRQGSWEDRYIGW